METMNNEATTTIGGEWIGKKLTLAALNNLKPGAIIAHGESINAPGHLYMTDTNIGRKLTWVAKRGGINDWAIYTTWHPGSIEYCMQYGDKVHTPEFIRRLVDCDDAAFERYRH